MLRSRRRVAARAGRTRVILQSRGKIIPSLITGRDARLGIDTARAPHSGARDRNPASITPRAHFPGATSVADVVQDIAAHRSRSFCALRWRASAMPFKTRDKRR